MGEKIKQYRLTLGLSQGELAARLFVTRQAVSKWELGKSVPDIETLKKMAAMFGCTLDELTQDSNLGLMVNDSIAKVKRITSTQKLMLVLISLTLIALVALCIVLPLTIGKTNYGINNQYEQYGNDKFRCAVGVYMEANGDGKFSLGELKELRDDNAFIMFDPENRYFDLSLHNVELFTTMDGNAEEPFSNGKTFIDIYGTLKMTNPSINWIDYWEVDYINEKYVSRYQGTLMFRDGKFNGCINVVNKNSSGFGSYFYIRVNHQNDAK